MGKRALTLHLTLNMASAQEKAEEAVLQVFQLFEAHGGDDYIGEAITQVEHATQAAKLAKVLSFSLFRPQLFIFWRGWEVRWGLHFKCVCVCFF